MKLKRLLSHYHWKMPVNIALILQEESFNPDKFASRYSRLPDLSITQEKHKKPFSKKVRIFSLFGYYLWAVYIISAVTMLQVSVVASILALLLSPLIAGGGMYALAYVVWSYRHNFITRRKKSTKKK